MEFFDAKEAAKRTLIARSPKVIDQIWDAVLAGDVQVNEVYLCSDEIRLLEMLDYKVCYPSYGSYTICWDGRED